MAFGVAALILPLIALIFAGGLSEVVASFNDDVSGFLAGASLIVHLVLAVPCFLAGFYVRRMEDWARVLLIVISAINVLNLPVGTFLGIYGLWVLLQPESEPLFQNATRQQIRRRAAAAQQVSKKADGAEGTSTSVVPSPTE